jgi:hypothetical protein
MGKINVGKVIVGGIVAGIVMNGIDWVINTMIMKDRMAAAMAARNITAEPNIATMVMLDFAMALILVFTYACIRTRFGPGPKTAIVAGLIIAMSGNVLAAYFAGLGFFGWHMWGEMAVLETGNTVLAALAGCALYRE